MATKKCKILSVCILILHSISFCVESSQLYNQQSEGAFDVYSPNLVNIRHSRHRLKRDVTTKTVERSIEETKSNPIFSVRNEVTDPNSRLFTYVDASIKDLFFVDANGYVRVVSNKKLDYEDPSMREIKLYINSTSITDLTDVIKLDVTIRLQDVNDEKPVFKNQPSPFLATVPPVASSGVKVFELYAEDPDGNNVVYSLQTGSEGRFRVVTNTVFSSALNRNIIVGDVLTKGSGTFDKKEYQLVIQAADVTDNSQSTIATVSVKVGLRPPQFYEGSYYGKIPEQSSANQFLQNELKVQAKSFQGKAIKYELVNGDANSTESSPFFTINQNTGVVKTTNTLSVTDLDFESVSKSQRPLKYALTVKATEADTGLTSATDLIVELLDNNDNTPIFEYSSYQKTVAEDISITSSILTVKAVDNDSGTNAKIVYSVSDGNFSIETVNDPNQGIIGIIRVKEHLDYDRIVGNMYSFTVSAHDEGSPPRNGIADVRITVTNVNDEHPEIKIDNSTVYSVREDASPDYVVTFLQARDLDGDRVFFYFSPEQTDSDIFTIVPESGLIRLKQSVPSNVDMYVLNITVKDDGSCCGGSPILTSTAHLYVEIVDVNEHKPSFTNCSDYNSATVLEHQSVNTPIITVKAIDNDRNENGRVTYSILRSTSQPVNRFNVHRDTGAITSAVKFDREATQSYSLTIRGNDQANPSLEGYCTFRISIGDVNDNSPTFDQPHYTANIEQNYDTGRSVANVRAEDKDIGKNAEIEYFLTSNPNGRFKIEKDAGIIYLNKTLGADAVYNLVVMAKDKGNPPLNSSVAVTIKVAENSSKPPKWDRDDYDKTPININETASYGYLIKTFSAKSNVEDNENVLFNLIDNDGNPVTTMEPFFLEVTGQTVMLKVHSALDYNTKATYDLRLRVTNFNLNPLTSEISPKIQLIDMNNKVPYFVGRNQESSMYPGSVAENMPAGQTVIDVKAFDEDNTPPNNELTFTLLYKEGVSELFQIRKIDSNTARITTNAEFDRETKKSYFIQVKVEDGKDSDVPNHKPPNTPNSEIATVQVRITDQNDNHPYFEKRNYGASVKEDAGLQTIVTLVTALDPDTADILSYSITDGNIRNAFGVQTKKGIIYVARQLDYESSETQYNLTLMVSDGLHTNVTSVTINIIDVNDNRPLFKSHTYSISDVVEEDETISPQTPHLLTTVEATDADKSRPNDITYSLLGSGTTGNNPLFRIEPKSGKLYLLQPLDRDEPNGRATFQFNVRAMDEPQSPDTAQYGFASVEVKPQDINDNAPIFKDGLKGSVNEHSANGETVMTVIARDYDFGINGTVVYNINEGAVGSSRNNKFKINNDGLITTNTSPDELDREKYAVYEIRISAHDLGPNPTTSHAVVEITLNDINDMIPYFQQKLYSVTMSEFQQSEEIALVRATDNDIGENARLKYYLRQSDRAHFSVSTINNEGSIRVYKPVDYENPNERFFNLTVTVKDKDPSHTDVAYVQVTVEDFNDNAPVFEDKTIHVTYKENVDVGTELATFKASDADSGINALFTYHIDLKTDKRRQFAIDENSGIVTVRRPLDRETQEIHDITIQAIDQGDPRQTGTANLIVTLLDVNDNYPIFKEDYRPVVMENIANFPAEVIRVHGKDLDTPKFGAPFGFKSTKCADGTIRCPCSNRPTCQFFNLTTHDNGDGGNGEGIVMTLAQFDREVTKFYYMPIVMWDMRGTGNPDSMTGTNTLTIEIGDVNDNKHSSGHKDIFVYNYKGLFGNIIIGNVYATDPDDWDTIDKTFEYIGPDYLKTFFSVDANYGLIKLGKNVPEDKYTFTVSVYDKIWDHKVESTVTVTVEELSEEAVFKSGAVRLTGITAEEFMERKKIPNNDLAAYELSKSEKFLQLLANKIGAPLSMVQIISVMNNGEFTDVRYSAHGSPYYDPSKTNSVVSLNKKEFEDTIGIKIAMVPIDECREEKFEGGCYNYLNVTGNPALVNTNGTSFVGVETMVVALEGCRARTFPNPPECSPDFCFNGGKCVKDDWGGISCPKCPIGFEGPRCQGTHHSFDGKSYSLFKTLEQCKDGQTSIEFITVEPNGLILYNGPITELSPDDPTDFISLELVDGYPKLRIDHGTGELTLKIDGRDQHGSVKLQRLDNGKWHHIDIIREGKNVQLIVDRCQSVTTENDVTTDDEACRKSGMTPNENIFLNVNTLLQLGGRAQTAPPSYPSGITPKKFDGCIKNLIHNGEMYNLHIGGTPGYPAGKNGCKREEDICGVNSITGPVCGDNGICISNWSPRDYICICKPGYRGDKCNKETTTKDLQEGGYLQWKLSDDWFNNITPWKLQMQIIFRTRDKNGVLMTVSTSNNSKHVTLEIINGILQVKYDLGNSEAEQFLQLYYSPASDGRWHTVELQRYGKQFILKMDGGEGRNYNFTLGNPGEHEEINIQRVVYAGASVSFSSGVALVSSGLTDTCVDDIRIENGWFPMDLSENSQSKAATLLKGVKIKDDCIRNDCVGVVCKDDRVCYPLWGIYECRCPPGFIEVDNVCVKVNFCENDPCVAGRCDPVDEVCICEVGWSGEFCQQRDPGQVVAGLSTGAIVAIVLCIFIALILALVVIILVRFTERPKDGDKYILEVDPDEDIRENVMNYDEEGAGEEDHDAYDISRLRKRDDGMLPLDNISIQNLSRNPKPRHTKPIPDVGGFIDDRLGDADEDPNAPPGDNVCEYAYEGGGSDAGSLSSLNTTSSDGDQDYDYLNDWGPKFSKLADMYGVGQDDESNI